jgi:hypothetical protein
MTMDPTIATMLSVAFVVALVFSIHETKAALEPPFCTECAHCQERARAKAREEEDLREWDARRWHIPDEDDRPRR